MSIKKLQKELKSIKKKIKKTKLELNRREFDDSDYLEEATELLPKKYVEKSKLKKRADVIANLPILLIYEDKVELCQRKRNR